jgi:hypothetical protein
VKITLESTTRLVDVNGNPGRVWEGFTETGVPVMAVITRIAVDESLGPEVLAKFKAELLEQRAPSRAAEQVFPLRMIL